MRGPPELVFAVVSFLVGSGLQVSGYTNPILAILFFGIAGALTLHWAWPHLRKAAASALMYRPRVPWERRDRSDTTASLAAGDMLSATAIVRDPTPEQLAFRGALRSFVLSLERADAALVEFVEALLLRDAHPYGDTPQKNADLRYMLKELMALRRPKIGPIKERALYPIEQMGASKLQRMVIEYLNDNYARTQLDLFHYAGAIASMTDHERSLLKNWTTADAECVHKLRDLKASPEGAMLVDVSEAVMATVGRKWELGQ